MLGEAKRNRRAHLRRSELLLAGLLIVVPMICALVIHAVGEYFPSTSIEQFEAGEVAYRASVETGTSRDDLGLPDELRAVVALSDDDAATAAFFQVEPSEVPDTYEAPSDAEELYEAGETVIYTVSSSEDEALDYRVYGSVNGNYASWYSCDASGNLTGQVVSVEVTWEGTYDSDEPGVYTLTSSFTEYSYASARPYAVITVAERVEEESAQLGLSSGAVTYATSSAEGVISGLVWLDADGDGIQDAGELSDTTFDGMVVSLQYRVTNYGPLTGTLDGNDVQSVSVEIQHSSQGESVTYTYSNVQIGTDTYDITATATADGGYVFSGLPSGRYQVVFEAPDTANIVMGKFDGSPQDAGSDDTIDSDASYIYVDSNDDESITRNDGQWLSYAYINVFLTANDSQMTDYDVGFVLRTGSITVTNSPSGTTFELERYDESGNSWVTVGDPLTAGTNGTVVFRNLVPGEYRLTETAAASGNSLLVESVYITVPYDDGGDSNEDWGDTEPSYVYDGVRYMLDLVFDIESGTFALPSAGGDALPWYLMVGSTIVVLSLLLGYVAVSWRRRRRIQMLRHDIWASS